MGIQRAEWMWNREDIHSRSSMAESLEITGFVEWNHRGIQWSEIGHRPRSDGHWEGNAVSLWSMKTVVFPSVTVFLLWFKGQKQALSGWMMDDGRESMNGIPEADRLWRSSGLKVVSRAKPSFDKSSCDDWMHTSLCNASFTFTKRRIDLSRSSVVELHRMNDIWGLISTMKCPLSMSEHFPTNPRHATIIINILPRDSNEDMISNLKTVRNDSFYI